MFLRTLFKGFITGILAALIIIIVYFGLYLLVLLKGQKPATPAPGYEIRWIVILAMTILTVGFSAGVAEYCGVRWQSKKTRKWWVAYATSFLGTFIILLVVFSLGHVKGAILGAVIFAFIVSGIAWFLLEKVEKPLKRLKG